MEEQIHQIDHLLAKNELKKAEIAIARLIRSDLTSQHQSRVLYLRARSRFLSARPEDALEDLLTIRRIALSEFNTPPILELLGDCYLARFELASVGFSDRNDVLLAQHAYNQIVHNHPQYLNLGWVQYQSGRIWAIIGDIESAQRSFQEALLTPSHISTLTAFCYERLAFILFYESRDLDRAVSFLDRAITTFPRYGDNNWLVQVHLFKSRILRIMRRYETALEAAETALSMVSDGIENKLSVSEALLTIGELLSELGNHDKEVITVLQQFSQNRKKPLGVDVTWSRVNEMLGNAFLNLGRYDNAIEAYQTALQFNPDHPWALSLHYQIARSYYQQRAYNQAIKTVNHMLELATGEEQSIDDYRVFDILGNAQFALGDYENAVKSYQAALQIAPPNADNINKIKSYHDLACERIRITKVSKE